jgi:hypothetical protein
MFNESTSIQTSQEEINILEVSANKKTIKLFYVQPFCCQTSSDKWLLCHVLKKQNLGSLEENWQSK